MDKRQIKKAFEECIEKAKLDFALCKAPADCCTCSWDLIGKVYGNESHGIWLHYFTFGINKKKFNTGKNYINHYLTEKQKEIVFEVLSKYFKVTWDKNDYKTLIIENKEIKNENNQD